jgi:hypothetical protein
MCFVLQLQGLGGHLLAGVHAQRKRMSCMLVGKVQCMQCLGVTAAVQAFAVWLLQCLVVYLLLG